MSARLALLDAAASGRMAVCEAVTNIAAADIARIEDIRLSANWMAACGEPGEDADLYDTVHAVGEEFCPALGIAIPVGKDSLSMRSSWRDGETKRSVIAPLSLVISAFAPVADVRRTLTPVLATNAGPTVLLLVDLGCGRDRLGGSCLAQVYGAIGDVPPDLAGPQVWVDDENYARACEVLETFRAERERAGSVACSRCGEENPATFDLCWKCGGAL